MKNMKRGVSLITVLLFMLVATIAATATYKWLTSESRSSASRLMQAEAKESAVSGIEAARSWMTYHANDVGAIVKQFFDNGKQPISLNNVLPGIGQGRQNYNVSIVAADVSTNVYKLKIVSTGTSSKGTTHTEAAIMKVSGLYRVMVPSMEVHEDIELDYNFGYVGGGTTLDNNSSTKSGMAAMLVYGDLKGKELVAKSDLIVFGDLGDDNTNHLRVGGHTCVKGSMDVTNQEGFEQVNDIYVKGDAKFNMKTGAAMTNAYFGKDVTVGTKGADINITGDVTLGGKWTNSEIKKTHIGGNMCLAQNAWIDFRTPTNENQGPFTVDGSMWVPSAFGLRNGNNSLSDGKHVYVTLGTSENSELYIKNVELCSAKYLPWGASFYTTPTTNYYANLGPAGWQQLTSDGACPKDGDRPTYYYQGHDLVQFDIKYSCDGAVETCKQSGKGAYSTTRTAFTSMAKKENLHKNVAGAPSVTCNTEIKDFCDNYFNKPTTKCGHGASAKETLADLLKNAKESFGTKISECVTNLIANTNADLNNGNGIDLLNSCSSTTPESQKYNGYLVVKANAAWMNKLLANASKEIRGKYIFYVDEEPNSASKLDKVKLPPTATDAYVFLYLPNGAGEIDQNNGSRFNYFIYSEKDIAKISSSGGAWTGSFYMSSANCAKVHSFSSGDAPTVNFNQAFLNDLTSSKIICPSSAETCGDGATGSSSSIVIDNEVVFDGGHDSYHIATGAQLHIEVESEYANTEAVSNANPVAQSIVALPRIVYLNEDAVGKLTDYFSVMPLNGAHVEGNGTTSCANGGPSPTTALASQPDVIRKGKSYVCTYTEGSFRTYFFVAVTGEASGDARVSFESPASVFIQPTSSSSSTVNLFIPAIDGAEQQNIKVEVYIMNNGLTGWTISKIDATPNFEEKPGSGGHVFVYSGTAGASNQTVPLFTVQTDAGAQAGSVIFALQSPEGCSIVGNATKTYSITGSATIKRESIAKYCETYPDNCTGANSKYATAANEEDCGDLGPAIWIEAWPNCTTEEGMANEQWKCPSGNSSNNPIQLRALSYDDSKCVLYKPDLNNSIVGAKDDGENPNSPYILYASLKKRSFGLHLEKEGAKASKLMVYTKNTESAEYESYDECTAVSCDYSIPVGTYVKVVANATGDDRFNYWTCHSSDCNWVNNVSPTIEFVMGSAQSYKAHFNERDDHCFYSSFDHMAEECMSYPSTKAEECIDKCGNNNSRCAVASGLKADNAKWLMVFADNSTWPMPSASSGYLSNDNSGKVAFIMHRNVAGPNGILTARIKTARIPVGREKDMLNDGFVFRSNKTVGEYLMVNIYGKNDNKAYARVCYSTGVNSPRIANTNKCIESQLKNAGGNSFSVTPDAAMNVKITLDKVNLNVELVGGTGGVYTHQFNLSSDWNYGVLNDVDHQYVGFKLSNPEFQIHDIGWRTTDFNNEACFDYPSISCSFAAKYLGGRVPLEKDVAPWIGYSSWFENTASCSVGDFFYNGCDMPSDYYHSHGTGDLTGSCATQSSDGYYNRTNDKKDGLKLLEKKFKFKENGPHGYLHEDKNGFVRNGSVTATCPNMENTSIELFANCGLFNVGELTACSRNEVLLNSTRYLGLNEEVIEGTRTYNLREASLEFSFTELADNADIKVVLVDVNGIESPARYISNSNASLDVDEMSGQFGFDPEKVKKVKLTGSSTYTLNEIKSSCAKAVSFGNCSAEFDKNSHKWVVHAPINNVQNAKKCKITANSNDIAVPGTFVSCNESGRFEVPDNTDQPFEEHLHTGTSTLQYKFTVSAYDDEEAQFTSEGVASCDATTEEYKKMTIDCSIPENEKTVIQGLGVPTLTYSFENCPSTGCYYSVSLTSDITEVGYGNGKTPVTGGTWKPEVNTKSDRLTTGTYSYTVKATNSTGGEYASCTTDEFEVLAAVEATASCSISGNTLSISATSSNYEAVEVSVAIVQTDVLGNVLWSQTLAINGDEVETTLDLNRDIVVAEGGTIVLSVLYGTDGQADCGTYERPVGKPTGTCSVNKSSIYSNESATFSVSNVTHCDSWILKKDGVTDPVSSSSTCGTSISVDNLDAGTYSLYYNGSDTAYCTETVTAKENVTLSCSSIAIDDKETATSVEITIPYGNLTVEHCDGCTYTVAATTTGAAVTNATGSYTGGDITFNATNPSGTIGYSLTMTDGGGHTTDACTFSVTYSSSSSTEDVCGCTCSDCSTIELTASGANEYQALKHCYYIDNENAKLRIDHVCSSIKINGTPIVGTHSETEIKNYGVDKVDEGYYLEVIHDGSPAGGDRVYCNFTINNTSSSNPCGSGSGSGSGSGGDNPGGGGGDEPSGDCHAPTGCSPTTTGSFNTDGKCYFATSIAYINTPATYVINGKSYSGYSQMCCNDYPDPVDGGYYIQTATGRNDGSSVTVGKPNCN